MMLDCMLVETTKVWDLDVRYKYIIARVYSCEVGEQHMVPKLTSVTYDEISDNYFYYSSKEKKGK